ncbi:MAG: YihA family ribosome biogenesis GTP-binding protein [Saprospirales bacterium]|nr:YihA family ribosome biogenesis GTP-binding protein [Saprospirales bacterium]MBK6904683.1 YihA family ribosome biogenesis GTP-binding protein [Saprospirales bacterium]
MEVKQAEYIGSFVRQDHCPKDEKPEYAFIGRSNVGKSSLINYLVGRKELAKVSKKPGKTQTLNYYLVNQDWYLVDLPGYGYAKVSQQQRASWMKMIEYYLSKREVLQCAFVLLDANIPLQANDLQFMNWLGQKQVPFVIVFTKCDRSSKLALDKNLRNIRAQLSAHWQTLPEQFISSASKSKGREEILEFIDGINRQYFDFQAENPGPPKNQV